MTNDISMLTLKSIKKLMNLGMVYKYFKGDPPGLVPNTMIYVVF